MNTDRVILNSMLVTVASTVAASAAPADKGGQGSLPSPRLLIGTGLTYFGLGILADAAPGVAGPLAVAIAVTAVTYYGVPVLDAYMGLDPKSGRTDFGGGDFGPLPAKQTQNPGGGNRGATPSL